MGHVLQGNISDDDGDGAGRYPCVKDDESSKKGLKRDEKSMWAWSCQKIHTKEGKVGFKIVFVWFLIAAKVGGENPPLDKHEQLHRSG